MLPGNMHVEFLDHCFLFRNSIYVFPAYASRAFSNQCIEEEQSIKLPGAGVRYVSLRRRQRPAHKKLFAWHGLNVRLACCVDAHRPWAPLAFENFQIGHKVHDTCTDLAQLRLWLCVTAQGSCCCTACDLGK